MPPFECTVPLDGELPPCDPKIAALFDYWRSIRPQGRLLPGRQHFDPADISPLLPTIWLYDVHRAPWRFRYRVVGTEIARVHGKDATGAWFHETRPDVEQTQAWRDLVFVAEGRGLSYHCGFPLFHIRNKDHLSSERILLPLARDGREVDMVLALGVFHLVNGKPVGRAAALAV